MRKTQILSRPTHPLAVDGRKSVAALLEKMQGVSFQGRSLATAYQIWKKMLGGRVMRQSHNGHKYAVQVIIDAARWGGLSGCTFEEAQSWGKIAHDASMVDVHCDSTIALPLLVTALSQNIGLIRKRKKPAFEMGRELKFTFPK